VQDVGTDPSPRVLAVLVAHDGVDWLPRTLASLEVQTHPDLRVVAVDNASEDGSRQLLIERLGPDRVLVAERDLGFGGAVAMALDAVPADEAPYVLLVHDDCALAPDAVAHLVAALEADQRVAIVGPKLVAWDRPDVLQAVGSTIDLTGRAEVGVDEGELDQGQHDEQDRALYVSTCGMLARREVLDRLGRFDRRFHVFRDDLDLCWRAWLAGEDVEVVPDAVVQHVAGAANYLRLGQTRFLGARYFAERNTLAALLKNYGTARLALVVPLYFLVGIAKVFGFVLTRRLSDAWQTVRAWLWNAYHLRETWRFRREVQAARRRSDGELKPLFGRIAPRLRAYAEAIAEWIAGADVERPATPEPSEQAEAEPASVTQRALTFVRARPILLTGAALLTLFAVGTWPLWLPGEIRGGALAPWPRSADAFLGDYASGFHEAAAFGTAATPSPAQAVLGFVQLAVGGSAYLAPRLLLVGSLAVAWLLALRASQPYSRKKLPRVVAATAYVLSPPALAALTMGEVGALVVLAVAPGLVAAGTTMARRRSTPHQAWRAVAAATLLGAVAGAFEPIVLPGIVLTGVAVLAVGLARSTHAAWWRSFASRVVVATVGPLVLLLPWSLELLDVDGPLLGAPGVLVDEELLRWLALSPDLAGVPGVAAGVGFLLAGLLGLALGVGRQPRLVAGLWSVALAGAVLAWWLGREGSYAWPGLPLLLTAGAFAGLLAMAFASAEAELTRHAFGWRQVAVLATGGAVALSLLTVAGTLVRTPWDTYAVDDPALPSFVVAAAEQDEPFRVLMLADQHGVVTWDVVEGAGPTMAAYGIPESTGAHTLVGAIVEDVLTGRDPGAAGRLGVLNVRYVVVPPGGASDELARALRGQLGLEPRPVVSGKLFALQEWLPRAVVVPAEVADSIRQLGDVPEDAEVQRLTRDSEATYRGVARSDGALLLAEAADPDWVAVADGRPLRAASGETVWFDEVPEGARVALTHGGQAGRTFAVSGQVLAVLLAISLALRPPSFAGGRDDGTEDGPPRAWTAHSDTPPVEVVG
jgi:GT2 family glycosyltransferase